MDELAPRRICRFGAFEVDCATKELRKHGLRLRLAGKPFDLLLALLERPGEIVTREELRTRLWSADTFVEFDHNLNTSINRLRETLSDSAEAPRFIKTHSRHGYRFIAPVEWVPNGARADVPAPPVAAKAARRSSYLKPVALLGALAVLLIVAWFARPTSEPALSFPNRGWVLIADFENRSSEAVLDGTVEYALERELSNSRFVNVVPVPRIQDTLRLMKKPENTPLDPATAREVALRDGNIQLVLTGRTEKIGSRYLFSASLVSPATGVTRRTASEEADGLDAVLPAIRRLSNEVRRNLGEELRPETGEQERLEKVTTPSLRALQLFSQGMKSVNKQEFEAAIPLFEEAIGIDPDFASAHIYLAHCYSNLDQADKAAPHYESAFRLADSTPDVERYFILGSYYGRFANNQEKAIGAYRTLMQLYPDHYWGANNLAHGLESVDGREAFHWWLECLRLRPNDPRTIWRALMGAHEFDLAMEQKLYRRLRELTAPEFSKSIDPQVWRWVFEEKADVLGHRGDLAGAAQEAQRLAEEASRMKAGDRRNFLLLDSSDMLISLGRLHDAGVVIEKLSQPDRDVLRSRLAQERGDRKALREAMKTYRSWGHWLDVESVAALGLAQLGRLSECRQYLAKEGEFMGDLGLPAKGELLLAEGRPADAIAELQPALERFLNAHRIFLLHEIADRLARAYEAQGELDQAAEQLETALRFQNIWDYRSPEARLRLHLVRLYRRLGRPAEAERVEKDLRAMLAAADPDHPILQALASQR